MVVGGGGVVFLFVESLLRKLQTLFKHCSNILYKQFVVVYVVHSSGIKVLHANGPSLKVIFIVCIRDTYIYGYAY